MGVISVSKNLSGKTVRAIFEQAGKKEGIVKDVGIHNLRHSFVTYLLESGVDSRCIQELLAHKSSKTTEVYTHARKKSLVAIRRLLDRLNLKKCTRC